MRTKEIMMPSKATLRRWLNAVKKEPLDPKLEDLRQGISIGLQCALYNWKAIKFIRFGTASQKSKKRGS